MAKKQARLNDLTGSDVFFGSTPSKRETTKTVKKKKEKPAIKEPVEEPKIAQSPTPKLIRATFYFFPDQLDDLEEIRLQIKRDHKIKTDKSSIVRIALSEIIENYRKNKNNNALKAKLQS
jgi:hypothetical protein